jgi:hypothetical protein
MFRSSLFETPDEWLAAPSLRTSEGNRRRLLKHRGSARCEQLGGFYRAEEELMERSKRRYDCRLSKRQEGHLMKLRTIVLATAFALSSTFALAQSPGLSGYGSSVAPSVGSYVAPSVGSSVNPTPTWRTTGPAAPLPRTGNAFGNTRASMHLRRGSVLAPTGPRSGRRR